MYKSIDSDLRDWFGYLSNSYCMLRGSLANESEFPTLPYFLIIAIPGIFVNGERQWYYVQHLESSSYGWTPLCPRNFERIF